MVVRRFVECANVSVDRTHTRNVVGRWPHAFIDLKIDHAEQHVHLRVLLLSGVSAELFYRLP